MSRGVFVAALFVLGGCQLLLGIESREVFEGDAGAPEALPSPDSATLPDGAPGTPDGGDGGDAGLPSDAGAFPNVVEQGDVVAFTPDSLEYEPNGQITAWRDVVSGTRKATKAEKAESFPFVVTAGGRRCAELGRGALLVLKDEGDLDPKKAGGELSVLAVVQPSAELNTGDFGRAVIARARTTDPPTVDNQWHYAYRGYALFTEYRSLDRGTTIDPRRYAARLEADLSTGIELVEPSGRPSSAPEELEAVALQLTSSQLHLHVGARTHSRPVPEVTQPDQADLLIGKVDSDTDFTATGFKGKLCAVIVHHGVESPEHVRARLATLRAAFR
jgi:hypothetical protein